LQRKKRTVKSPVKAWGGEEKDNPDRRGTSFLTVKIVEKRKGRRDLHPARHKKGGASVLGNAQGEKKKRTVGKTTPKEKSGREGPCR